MKLRCIQSRPIAKSTRSPCRMANIRLGNSGAGCDADALLGRATFVDEEEVDAAAPAPLLDEAAALPPAPAFQEPAPPALEDEKLAPLPLLPPKPATSCLLLEELAAATLDEVDAPVLSGAK